MVNAIVAPAKIMLRKHRCGFAAYPPLHDLPWHRFASSRLAASSRTGSTLNDEAFRPE
jgi:hypothetical protein